MGYLLRAERPIAREVRRIADKQLAAAVADLATAESSRRDAAIHSVRRHVKKVRALLRLVRPALGDAYGVSNRRLRRANQLLAPIADGRAVMKTIARLRRKYRRHVDVGTLAAVRAALVDRITRVARRTAVNHLLPRVSTVLTVERARVGSWTLNARDFGAVESGLERSMRQARRAMRRALRHPTGENFHVWRQRVKDLWFHTRLLEARTGGHLTDLERRLDALDGWLGESHNVVVLEQVLAEETPLSRGGTAASLRLLRRDQQDLRRHAAALGGRVLEEKPRPFVRRVRRLWRAEARRRKPGARRTQSSRRGSIRSRNPG
jgi:hypothetical protein